MNMDMGAYGASASNTLSRGHLGDGDDGKECTVLNHVLEESMALPPTQKVGAWPGI
jgi:hypothetical protein